jgi:hypothetical protein
MACSKIKSLCFKFGHEEMTSRTKLSKAKIMMRDKEGGGGGVE